MTRFRSPRALARNHGAAGIGTGGFFWERLTTAALIPLGAVLLLALLGMSESGLTLAEARGWLGHPVNAAIMIVFFTLAMINAYLCSRTLIEDYLHQPALNLLALIGLMVVTVVLGVTAVMAVLSTLFGG